MAAFTNFATLRLNGASFVSNTVSGEILETLSMTKTAAAQSYTPGGDVSYVLSLVNSGEAPLTGLTVTDDLGGYPFEQDTVYPLAYKPGSLRYFVDGEPQPEPTVTAGPPLVIGDLSVPAGASAMLVYEAEVTDYAPPAAGGSIVNTATVTGDSVLAPITASATLTAAEAAELAVRKALSPAAVEPGGTVTYTFTIENSGNSAVAAGENAVLTDDFAPVLTGLSAELDGIVWRKAVNYSYDETTGAFATLPGQLAVPAASFTRAADGSWVVTPGAVTLRVSGTL